jgi:hypothetical protein
VSPTGDGNGGGIGASPQSSQGRPMRDNLHLFALAALRLASRIRGK